MKWFLISVLITFFVFGVTIAYLRVGKPAYKKSEVRVKPYDEIERDWRASQVTEFEREIKKFEEPELQGRLNRALELVRKLKEPLPKNENDRVVDEIKNLVSDVSSDLVNIVERLRIRWEPNLQKVKVGKELYDNLCMTCHGVEGDSLSVTPEGLRTDLGDVIYARDFTGKYHRDGKVVFKFASDFTGEMGADEDIKLLIREGLAGTPMPGFPYLKEQELDAILEYIKSLNPRWKFFSTNRRIYPEPPEDLLTQTRVENGRELFKTFCSACHRNPEKGESPLAQPTAWYKFDKDGRITGGDSPFQVVSARYFGKEPLRRGKPEYIFAVIKNGIAGTTMTPWAHLGEENIWNLVAYILYLDGKKIQTAGGEGEKGAKVHVENHDKVEEGNESENRSDDSQS